METSALLGCMSAACAFSAAFFAGWALLSRWGLGRPSGALREVGGGRTAWLLRNGVSPAKPLARALLRLPRVAAFADEAVWLCAEQGVSADAQALGSLGVTVLCVLALAVGLFSRSAVCALAVAALAASFAVAAVRTAQDRRHDAMREAVPDALRSMEACFQAGFTLMQTFAQMASESHGPLRKLFARTSHVLETGGSVEEALALLRAGAAVPELAFVAVALDVQHQAGGSLKQVLDSACEAVEGELALKRSLRVQTAQAKLSARIVSVMPFALIALFSLVSDGFLEPFFASATGMALLAAAIAMQAAGIAVVRRMLAVEVGA